MSPSEKMMCRVKAFSYNYEGREGLLFVEEGEICSMSGCVSFFENIDPDARVISTFSGGRMDTIYVRIGREWVAKEPPRSIHCVTDAMVH